MYPLNSGGGFVTFVPKSQRLKRLDTPCCAFAFSTLLLYYYIDISILKHLLAQYAPFSETPSSLHGSIKTARHTAFGF